MKPAKPHCSTVSPANDSRRQFLKQSGQIAATSALAGLVVPRCHAAGDATIKLALIGCGGRGTGAVSDAFHTTGGPVKLHAMADVFEHRLNSCHQRLSDQFADRVDVPAERRFVGFDAYKHAIDSLSPGDVAALTAYANFRPSQFEYAVAKGVHVFAEKSFAVDGTGHAALVEGSRSLGAEEPENGVRADVAALQSSARGDSADPRRRDRRLAHLADLPRPRPGPLPRLPAGANELTFQLQRSPSFTWITAGFFVDWHCHNVDVACWAKNAWPVSAQAMGGRCYAEAGNQFDHFTVEYTLPDGTKLFAFARHMNNCWNTYSDYAHGTKGAAVIMDNLGDPKPRIYKGHTMESGDLVWEYGQRDNNPYVEEWQLLLDAIRNDTPHNEARRAGEANLASLMGRAATHTGAYITWDQMLQLRLPVRRGHRCDDLRQPGAHPSRTGRHLRPAAARHHQGSGKTASTVRIAGHGCDQDRVVVLIGGHTATQQPKRDLADVRDLMDRSGWNGDGVTGSDFAGLVAHLHPALSFENVVDFLGQRMIMGRGRTADRHPRLGQTLPLNTRIPVGQKFTNLRTVFGDKGRNLLRLPNIHPHIPRRFNV
jgi:predicted dehydrogenase